jgi:hypothetical protein
MSGHTNHAFFVTQKRQVFVIGQNGFLQSAVTESEAMHITKVTSLSQYSLKQISCGYGHSIFLTTDNKILTVGNPSFGQLGISNGAEDSCEPRLVDFNVGYIDRICAGYAHNIIVAGTNYHVLYGFGNNAKGQVCSNLLHKVREPTKIFMPESIKFRTVLDCSCGQDSSAILTDRKEVIIAGQVGQSYRTKGWQKLNVGPVAGIGIGEQNATIVLESGDVIYIPSRFNNPITKFSLTPKDKVALIGKTCSVITSTAISVIWTYRKNLTQNHFALLNDRNLILCDVDVICQI